MTKMKFCGLSRPCDIEAANELKPAYIGFVFAGVSRRYVPPERVEELKAMLLSEISAVGVFVNEEPERIAELADRGIIDLIQLHGTEDEACIRQVQRLTGRPVIKAFSIAGERDVEAANESCADYVLLDAGKGGTGIRFDWSLLSGMRRPFFLAGGLDMENAAEAVRRFHPYALDISSGIETDGVKDKKKMAAFAAAVRKAEIGFPGFLEESLRDSSPEFKCGRSAAEKRKYDKSKWKIRYLRRAVHSGDVDECGDRAGRSL